MKRFRIFVISILLIIFLFTQTSFAKEEVGFVKRTWRTLLSVFKKPVVKETPKPELKTKIEPPLGPKLQPETPTIPELPEEELRKRIKYMLQISPEVADFIPELKISKDEDGNIVKIEYEVEGIRSDLEELEKGTLIAIHNRINNERTRIQVERIQRQLEAIRAAQNVPRTPPISRPQPLPRSVTPLTPRLLAPTNVPSTPSPPKIPSAPPKPPAPPRK